MDSARVRITVPSIPEDIQRQVRELMALPLDAKYSQVPGWRRRIYDEAGTGAGFSPNVSVTVGSINTLFATNLPVDSVVMNSVLSAFHNECVLRIENALDFVAIEDLYLKLYHMYQIGDVSEPPIPPAMAYVFVPPATVDEFLRDRGEFNQATRKPYSIQGYLGRDAYSAMQRHFLNCGITPSNVRRVKCVFLVILLPGTQHWAFVAYTAHMNTFEYYDYCNHTGSPHPIYYELGYLFHAFLNEFSSGPSQCIWQHHSAEYPVVDVPLSTLVHHSGIMVLFGIQCLLASVEGFIEDQDSLCRLQMYYAAVLRQGCFVMPFDFPWPVIYPKKQNGPEQDILIPVNPVSQETLAEIRAKLEQPPDAIFCTFPGMRFRVYNGTETSLGYLSSMQVKVRDAETILAPPWQLNDIVMNALVGAIHNESIYRIERALDFNAIEVMYSRLSHVHDQLHTKGLDSEPPVFPAVAYVFVPPLIVDSLLHGKGEFDHNTHMPCDSATYLSSKSYHSMKQYFTRCGITSSNIDRLKLVYLVVFVHDISHWAFAVCNIQEHTFEYYDSFRKSPLPHPIYYELSHLFYRFLVEFSITPIPPIWKQHSLEYPIPCVPQQDDNIDCGVMVISAIQCTLAGAQRVDSAKGENNPLRSYYAKVLLDGQFSTRLNYPCPGHVLV